MKRCPLCGATCFEDADTCYCCMYRFDGEETTGAVLIAGRGDPQKPEEPEELEAPEESEECERGDAAKWFQEPAAPETIEEPEEPEEPAAVNVTEKPEESEERKVVDVAEELEQSSGFYAPEMSEGEPAQESATDESAVEGDEPLGWMEAAPYGTFEVPIADAELWFADEEGEAAREPAADVPGRGVFAFGPVIETLEGAGECLRFDIPLAALAKAAAAVMSHPGYAAAMR